MIKLKIINVKKKTPKLTDYYNFIEIVFFYEKYILLSYLKG